MGTHTGTHVDACSHMHEGGKTLDDIPLSRFCGKAFVVNRNQPFPAHAGLIFKEEADVDLFERIKSAQAPFVAGNLSIELERALLKADIVTYTNLVNLDRLPENTPFMFFGFPLKIAGGDGSPVRAVAILEESI